MRLLAVCASANRRHPAHRFSRRSPLRFLGADFFLVIVWKTTGLTSPRVGRSYGMQTLRQILGVVVADGTGREPLQIQVALVQAG
ncbi:MAG: hypothetical protein K0R61_5581 [Microvirga sp.]|nr:hypothetical protein [Microvirga sp.]